MYLASGSVDGSVIVWNGTTFGNTRIFCGMIALSNHSGCVDQVKRIEQQGGFVKGITWDPVGKFIAAQVCLYFIASMAY